MKAIVLTEYGSADALRFTEVAKPEPGKDEVRIEVHAASVNALDWRVMRGTPLPARMMAGGLRKPKPKPLGVDVAGRVEAVGSRVTKFREGDEVFGPGRGAFAEYACVKEDRLARKPANVSFEVAAGSPVAALTALQALRNAGRIQPGSKVLIDGASGGVGTFAVQIARALGAEVTAVCSTGNVEQARSLGATRVIDYNREDFTGGGERYDMILGANAHRSLFEYRRLLKPGGRFVLVGGGGRAMLQSLLVAPFLSLIGSRKMRFLLSKSSNADLVFIGGLLATRQIVTAIEKRYPLADTAEAIRYVEQGRARGKVVITVKPESES
jgi:NADPH:quinone reductase-like Zn-dependent oxidoreductase